MADTDDDLDRAQGRRARPPLRLIEGAPAQEAAERAIESRRREDERLEQVTRDGREPGDGRYPQEAMPAAEVAEPRRRAGAEAAQGDLRAEAAGERRVARDDRSRAAGFEADAADSDDPQAEAAGLAAADRFEASANHQDRIANHDDAASDSYGAEAGDHQTTAGTVPQPPAAEAVRTAPPRAPAARKNLKPRRRVKKQQSRDFGRGD